MVKIYLDVCCLNRPFDDQTQERIRLEAEAILLILTQNQKDEIIWVSSEIVTLEVRQNPDAEGVRRVNLLLQSAQQEIVFGTAEQLRATELEALGFHAFDAMHLACAESGQVDCFLTTDDKLLRRAQRFARHLKIKVENPIHYLLNH